MFEKEAKERARKIEENQTLGVYDNDEEYARDRGWNEGEVAGYEEGFKDGAEFGYNKAFVEADKNLKAVVTDFNKANEWYRVSDKLPEMDVLVYLWKKGRDFPLVARRHIPYGQKEWVWDCKWGSDFIVSQLKGKDYLWKEITLPKEIKEKCLD